MGTWMDYSKKGEVKIHVGLPEISSRRFTGENNREGRDTDGYLPF